MAKLFGFKIPSGDTKSKGVVSPVTPTEEDKSDFYVSSGFYGQYVDIEGCLLYTTPSPRDSTRSSMTSSA